MTIIRLRLEDALCRHIATQTNEASETLTSEASLGCGPASWREAVGAGMVQNLLLQLQESSIAPVHENINPFMLGSAAAAHATRSGAVYAQIETRPASPVHTQAELITGEPGA